MALNACEPSGKSQVSSARRFTPMRPAKTSRVRFKRRMASRRNTCCETDMGAILIYIRRAYILFMITTVDESFLLSPTKYNTKKWHLKRCHFCRDAVNAYCVAPFAPAGGAPAIARSEEHTSELQTLMSISYAVFCLKKKK